MVFRHTKPELTFSMKRKVIFGNAGLGKVICYVFEESIVWFEDLSFKALN